MTSKSRRSFAADSNVLLSAVAKKAAIRVFASPELVIVTTDENAVEVRAHFSHFATRYKIAEELLSDTFAILPIEIYSRDKYASHILEARALLGARDPADIPLAALALKLGVPIWSNDRDFEDFPTGVFTTASLLKMLDV